MHPEDKEATLAEYFRKYSRSDAHNIDRDIQEALSAVNFMPAKEVVFADNLDEYKLFPFLLLYGKMVVILDLNFKAGEPSGVQVFEGMDGLPAHRVQLKIDQDYKDRRDHADKIDSQHDSERVSGVFHAHRSKIKRNHIKSGFCRALE